MKKLFMLFVVLVMLAVMVIPAYAQEDVGTYYFNTRGTIVAVDLTAETVTMHVVKANPLARKYVGQDIVLHTTDNTKYYKRDSTGHFTEVQLKNLVVGKTIRARGTLKNSIFTANILRQGIILPTQ